VILGLLGLLVGGSIDRLEDFLLVVTELEDDRECRGLGVTFLRRVAAHHPELGSLVYSLQLLR
jgi:hypothetical protein